MPELRDVAGAEIDEPTQEWLVYLALLVRDEPMDASQIADAVAGACGWKGKADRARQAEGGGETRKAVSSTLTRLGQDGHQLVDKTTVTTGVLRSKKKGDDISASSETRIPRTRQQDWTESGGRRRRTANQLNRGFGGAHHALRSNGDHST